VKFPLNSVHQKLLKSVYFSPSSLKYKGRAFLDTVYKANVEYICCDRASVNAHAAKDVSAASHTHTHHRVQ